MSPVKLLHVADVHLDAPFRWLGTRGKEQRAQQKETFRTVVDLAIQEQVDVLLIAGDLFDNNSPAQDTIDLVRSQLSRLEIPAVILPGTHDCLDGNSVYRKVDLRVAGRGDIRIFDESHTAFEIGPLLTVHGRANLTRTSALSPLRDLGKNPAARFNVALAHGSLSMPATQGDFPISPQDIANSHMDYLALGHWHSFGDYSAGTVKACYSGPPELLAPGELGCALLVELGEAGVKIRRQVVGRRKHERVTLPLDQVGGLEEIRELIRGKRDADLVLTAILAGLRPLPLVIDRQKLWQECADGFFALKLEDSSHPMMAVQDIEALGEKTVIGQFATLISTTISEAGSEEDKKIAEAALQLGLALLLGRKVLQ